ncbi:hypothetical protein PTKIN_Ptkin16aG0079100 [Pterospermum kingtungense]
MWRVGNGERISILGDKWVRALHQYIIDDDLYSDLAGLKVNGWMISVSPGIQHFIWRVVSNIIPTACNLSSKGFTIDRECRVCGSGDETVVHLLLDCVFARAVWSMVDASITGWIKLNGDAAWTATDGIAVVGFVARAADRVVLCSAA